MYNKLHNNLTKIIEAVDNGTANPEKVQRAILIALKAIANDHKEPEYDHICDHDQCNQSSKDFMDNFSQLFGGK